MLGGFPSYILKKYIELLIIENYTVVLCEQVTPPPKPKREITEIISPATYIENQISISNNFLMAIYFSLVTSRSKNSFITASISWVDINTNKTVDINNRCCIPYIFTGFLLTCVIISYLKKR